MHSRNTQGRPKGVLTLLAFLFFVVAAASSALAQEASELKGAMKLKGQEDLLDREVTTEMLAVLSDFDDRAELRFDPVESPGILTGSLFVAKKVKSHKGAEVLSRRTVLETVKVLAARGINPDSRHENFSISICVREMGQGADGYSPVCVYGPSIYNPESGLVKYQRAVRRSGGH